MGKIEYSKEKTEEVVQSLQDNECDLKVVAEETGVPIASVRQIMKKAGMEQKKVVPERNEVIKRNNEVLEAKIMRDESEYDELDREYRDTAIKTRNALMEKIFDRIDYVMDAKVLSDILKTVHNVTQEISKEETPDSNTTSFLEELSKRMMLNKKQ